ncbi:MAG TPA: hypothetical protein VG253_12590 [Streptosporangiaceae bacterium]|nr:hypothetical protein [Streptosporangiaceae bacterium]
MAEFTFDFGDLSGWQREQGARHCEVTYNMLFGGLERQTAMYFRVDVAECVNQSAPAAALRDLTAAFRTSGPVRVKLRALGRGDRYKLSALLEQTAARPGREGNTELASALERLWREFDRQAGVSGDEYARAEHVLTGR